MKVYTKLQAAAFLAQQQRTLLTLSVRGIKNNPRYNPEEDANKINAFGDDLAAYFDDLMRRRPANKGGYINLPKENFKAMVFRAKNQTDLGTLVNALANYIGHRNILPQSYVDLMVMKGLELGHPESMFEIFRLHRELLYHPSPEVLAAYAEKIAAQGFDKLLAFYQVVRGNYFLQLPKDFYANVLMEAHKAGDAKTVRNIYLDILDYQNSALTADHILAVFESLSYETCIDHALVEHLVQTGTKLGVMGDNINIKLHQAVYYVKVKGYLTAVDLIKEAAALNSKVAKSELLKTHLFSALSSQEIEASIRDQLVEAVK